MKITDTNSAKYISHIKDPDKLVKMRRILDKINITNKNHSMEITDFLDPYEIVLAKSILNKFKNINYGEYGGYEESERKVIAIFKDYYDENDIEYNLCCLKVTGTLSKFNHRDYLGSILKLGIKRAKIGDIQTHEDSAFVILKKDIKDFLLFNLEKVGNQNVNVEEFPLEKIHYKEPNFKEVRGFLNSLRLDLVVSFVCNVSRNESSKIINSNKVKVNWETIYKGSKELEIGDIVSVKGFGRFIIHSFEGHSKKGKLNIIIRILI